MSNSVLPSPWYDTLQQLKSEIFKGLRVCLPGTISAIDAATGTVSVKVGIMQNVAKSGTTAGIAASYPDLTMCPIFTLQGGGVAVHMPVKIGDECMVVFSDRCLDAWFSTGQAAALPNLRMHDISDGFVLVGPNSLAKLLVTPLLSGEGGLCESSAAGAVVAIDSLTHLIKIQNSTQNLKLVLLELTTALTTLNTAIASESAVIPISAAAATTANVAIALVNAHLAALLK